MLLPYLGLLLWLIITLHAQSERGKVIGLGVLMWTKKKIEPYFSDRLTFSNVHGMTSHRIYRLVLALLSLETLSSLSKQKIFVFNAHLTLFVQRMT